MATLQVRDLPDHLYEELMRQAQNERRSLTQQTVATLAKGLGEPVDPREKRLEALRQIAAKIDRRRTAHLSDPVKLIREDRTR
jgi:hypothetical protein